MAWQEKKDMLMNHGFSEDETSQLAGAMADEMHKLCGQVAELRQLALAMVSAMGDMRERLAKMTVRTMLIAAGVSLGGGIIAAVITTWSWLSSRLDSVFGVRP